MKKKENTMYGGGFGAQNQPQPGFNSGAMPQQQGGFPGAMPQQQGGFPGVIPQQQGGFPGAGGFNAQNQPQSGFNSALSQQQGGFGSQPGAQGTSWGQQTGGFGNPAGSTAVAANTDYDVPNPNGDILSSMAWSPAGTPSRLLACTSWDKEIRVWEVQTQPGGPVGNYGFNGVSAIQAKAVAKQTAQQPPLTCAISSDMKVAFGGCCKTVQLWNLATNQLQQVAAHDAPVSKVQFVLISGQNFLVTSGWDHKLRFWDMKSSSPLMEYTCSNPIFDFDAQGAPGFVAILEGRQVHLYNINSRQVQTSLAPPETCPFQFRRVTTFQNAQMSAPRVVVGTADGRVVVWNLHVPGTQAGQGVMGKQNKAHGSLHEPPAEWEYEAYPLNFVAVHPSGLRVWTAASDGALKGFEANEMNSVNFIVKEGINPVPCAAQHPDGTLIAYGLGYDWSLGKDHYNKTAPNQIKIHMITQQDMDKPKS